MNTRKLGKTGYDVSEIGLGCWQLGGDFGPVGDDTANEILRTARSLDVNFWDTADVYGGGQSESRIGAFKDKKGVLVVTKPAQLKANVAAGTMDPLEPALVGKLKDFYVEKVRPAVRGGI
jgi:aryl-alcohol dehydrogenase-like predicted oxidoreductase